MAIQGLYIEKRDYDINTVNSTKILNAYYILDTITFEYEYNDNNLEQNFVWPLCSVYTTQDDRNNRVSKLNTVGLSKEITKNIDLGSMYNTLYNEMKQKLINEYTEYLKQTLNVDVLPEEYQNMIVFTDV